MKTLRSMPIIQDRETKHYHQGDVIKIFPSHLTPEFSEFITCLFHRFKDAN